MTKATIILLAIMTQACNLVSPCEVFQVESGEYGFTDAEMTKMTVEADRLCELTDGAYCPILKRGDAPNRITHTYTSLGPANGRTDMMQDYQTAHIVVIIKPGMSDEDFMKTWKHELGHAGGCLTHNAAGNLMSGDLATEPDDWTQADLDCIDGEY